MTIISLLWPRLVHYTIIYTLFVSSFASRAQVFDSNQNTKKSETKEIIISWPSTKFSKDAFYNENKNIDYFIDIYNTNNMITSPADSFVSYAGPYRDFGHIIVLNMGCGLVAIFSGDFEKNSQLQTGHFLLRGEAFFKESSINNKVLFQIRKDGIPVNPYKFLPENQSDAYRIYRCPKEPPSENENQNDNSVRGKTESKIEIKPPRKSAKAQRHPEFDWPVEGATLEHFSSRNRDDHGSEGIQIFVPEGTPVMAARPGLVVHADNVLKGYGGLILIRHSIEGVKDPYITIYANLSELHVKRNETIKKGQVIGLSGRNVSTKLEQLHFEIRIGTTPLNPFALLTRR